MKLTKDILVRLISEELESFRPRGLYQTDLSFQHARSKELDHADMQFAVSKVEGMFMENPNQRLGGVIHKAVHEIMSDPQNHSRYMQGEETTEAYEVGVANALVDKYGSVMNFYNAVQGKGKGIDIGFNERV